MKIGCQLAIINHWILMVVNLPITKNDLWQSFKDTCMWNDHKQSLSYDRAIIIHTCVNWPLTIIVLWQSHEMTFLYELAINNHCFKAEPLNYFWLRIGN